MMTIDIRVHVHEILEDDGEDVKTTLDFPTTVDEDRELMTAIEKHLEATYFLYGNEPKVEGMFEIPYRRFTLSLAHIRKHN